MGVAPHITRHGRRLRYQSGSLRVREHQKTGSYVEDLTWLAVKSYAEMERYACCLVHPTRRDMEYSNAVAIGIAGYWCWARKLGRLPPQT